MQKYYCSIYYLFIFLFVCIAKEDFHEELLIRPLQDGKVMTHFQFTTQWQLESKDQDFTHFGLFPKSLGQTIQKFSIEELHLSFTQGRWWSERWGFYPIISAPVGVELWTWFAPISGNNTHKWQEKERVDALWKGLTGTLSGMFCASLEQMKITVTGSPTYCFKHEGNNNFAKNQSTDSVRLRYSVLPREAICTENLTPWIKMLPCRSKAGLGSLLNALALYDVSYHSMGIHIRSICKENCGAPILELVQTLTIVFDPKHRSSSSDWSLQSLFKKAGVSACPLATTSQIFIEHGNYEIELSPAPSIYDKDTSLGYYDLTKMSSPLSLSVKSKERTAISESHHSQLLVQRYFTGYGQEFGGIAVHIFNYANYAVNITYFELIPWYLRVYFHTFTIHVNNVKYDPMTIFDSYKFVPAEDRASPTTIEFSLTLPPKSTTHFTIQFEKAFLHWSEHPPDANRGFDIGSAVITAQLSTGQNNLMVHGLEWSPVLYGKQTELTTNVRIYTEGLLVSLPTPDFSMPYNVITLTGTIFALFFGSVLNVLTRRMKNLEQIRGEFVSNRPMAKIFRAVLRFIDGE